MKAKQITLIVSIIYFVIGNLIGYYGYTSKISDDNVLYLVFAPYTMWWGMSAMVGVDWSICIPLGISFLLSIAVFFPIGLYFGKDNKNVQPPKL